MRGKLAQGQSDDSEELLNRAKQKQADLQAAGQRERAAPPHDPAGRRRRPAAPAATGSEMTGSAKVAEEVEAMSRHNRDASRWRLGPFAGELCRRLLAQDKPAKGRDHPGRGHHRRPHPEADRRGRREPHPAEAHACKSCGSRSLDRIEQAVYQDPF